MLGHNVIKLEKIHEYLETKQHVTKMTMDQRGNQTENPKIL